MSNGWSEKYDVVIAGSGMSAAATALRLLSFGLRPILIQRPGPIHRSAEAIPEAALRLFRELNLERALRDAGGVAVEGFETSWGKSTISKPDWFVHVDRIALAKTTIAEAVKRGAGIVACERLPSLHFDHDFISLTIDNTKFRFRHAVDATGRAAAWSRPVDRSGSRVADMFHTRVPKPLLRGKVASSAQGWAYRIGLPTSVTVGVIANNQPTLRVLPSDVAAALQISSYATTYIGRRPAFPQWCLRPAKRSQIAVGDAALAHDPLAGQGIRFALGSALAAAAVIRTSCDLPQNSELAESYYNELIRTEKERHISFLETSYSRSNREAIASPSEADDTIEVPGRDTNGVDARWSDQNRLNRIQLSDAVSFVGTVSVEGVQYNGLIVPREVIRLDNGTSARWLGDFDLLRLRQFAMTTVPVAELLNHLLRERLTEQKAIRLIDWCLTHRILSAASL
jgi:flavin-dependent dehydrogenase